MQYSKEGKQNGKSATEIFFLKFAYFLPRFYTRNNSLICHSGEIS